MTSNPTSAAVLKGMVVPSVLGNPCHVSREMSFTLLQESLERDGGLKGAVSHLESSLLFQMLSRLLTSGPPAKQRITLTLSLSSYWTWGHR